MPSKQVRSLRELESAIKSGENVILLLYASWCPFSQKFLPEFEECVAGKDATFLRFMVEDESERWDRYSVRFTPTVVCFKNGRQCERLDGMPGRGLTRKQFTDFLMKVL